MGFKSKLISISKNQYVFSVLSKFCIVFLGFAYTVCQSRYLGASLKGDISYVQSITQITSIVFCLGIHQAYPYFKKKTGKNVAPFFMKLAIAIMGIYFVIAILLSVCIHGDIKIVAIFMMTPLLAYNKIVSYINMVESPNKKNATELVVNILELVAVLILWIAFPATIEFGLFLVLFKDLFLAIIYSWRLRSSIFEPIKLEMDRCIDVVRFGFFPMLALLMTTLNYRVDVIMLKQYVTSAEVGIYSVGVMLAERVWMIPDALKEVMISNLAKGKGTDEVCLVIRVCNVACLIVVMGIVLLGQPFINIFFGSEYSSAYSVTVVILIGVIFMVYYKMIGAYNIVHGKQKENFVYLVISVICNIAANITLIPVMGIIGASIASVFSYGISAFLFIYRFSKDNDIRLNDMLFLKKEDISKLKRQLLGR